MPNSLTDPKQVPIVTIRSDQVQQRRIEDDQKRVQTLPLVQPLPPPPGDFGPPPNTFISSPIK